MKTGGGEPTVTKLTPYTHFTGRQNGMYLGYFKKIKEAAGHPLIMMAMVGGDYHD